MTSPTAELTPCTVRDQLRALNAEFRDTQEALNHLNRAIRLSETNYQCKRRAILAATSSSSAANGHGEDPL